MKNSTLKTLCVFASIGAILISFALMIVALSPRMTSSWGEVASGFTPHAILIVGGLISLAICSTKGSNGSKDDE